MAGQPVARDTTLAILLGGSEWPKSPQLAASAAFAASAQDFRAYLIDERGFNLPAANILDLFDSPRTAPDIVEEVQNYLKGRTQSGTPPRDLFIYYTGHGGFINGRDYFLAVRSTIEGLEGSSSVRVADLAAALRNAARDVRRFLILDCCFAAAAFKEFQSTPGSAARLQTLDAFPRRGTTLLCSSSSRSVSIAPTGQRNTMFSGALLDVLRNGDTRIDGPLSLEDVGLRIGDLIRDRYENRAIRPEVHSPDQREEDIARMPLFPNPARGDIAPRPIHTPVVPRPRRIQLAASATAVFAILTAAGVTLKRPGAPANPPQPTATPPVVTSGPAPANAPKKDPLPAEVRPPKTTKTAVSASRDVSAPTAPAATRPMSTPGAALDVDVGGETVRLVALRGGEFRMGCTGDDGECADDEKPMRRVSVDPFQISATEVTQDVWQAVMKTNPSDFKGARRPVEHVSWNDAHDFLDALNQRHDGFSYRLPTEAEWEYAARAGGSAEPALTAVAWFGLAESASRASRPQPVGVKKPNAWGLYDMLGNVAEWCEDWYSPNYQRVVRGGSWMDGEKALRLSARGKAAPGTKDYSIGLRIVRVPAS